MKINIIGLISYLSFSIIIIIHITSQTKEASDYIIKEEYNDIHNNIKTNNLKQRTQDKVKFNENDKVRIKLDNPDDYGKLLSDKVYIIDKINVPKSRVSSVYYQLKGDNKHYYNNDLQLINNIENKIDNDELYIVSKIIEPKIIDGEKYYLIKWKGYSNKHNTYEPRNNLMEDIPKLIKRYEKEHKVIWKSNKVIYD